MLCVFIIGASLRSSSATTSLSVDGQDAEEMREKLRARIDQTKKGGGMRTTEESDLVTIGKQDCDFMGKTMHVNESR